jgi:hypothetical protein
VNCRLPELDTDTTGLLDADAGDGSCGRAVSPSAFADGRATGKKNLCLGRLDSFRVLFFSRVTCVQIKAYSSVFFRKREIFVSRRLEATARAHHRATLVISVIRPI